MKCWKCYTETTNLDTTGLCPDCAAKQAKDTAYWTVQLANINTTLTAWNDRGWTWTWADKEWRTNAHGDGLFYRQPDGTWQQAAGTSQFSLPAPRNQAIFTLKAYYRRLLGGKRA